MNAASTSTQTTTPTHAAQHFYKYIRAENHHHQSASRSPSGTIQNKQSIPHPEAQTPDIASPPNPAPSTDLRSSLYRGVSRFGRRRRANVDVHSVLPVCVPLDSETPKWRSGFLSLLRGGNDAVFGRAWLCGMGIWDGGLSPCYFILFLFFLWGGRDACLVPLSLPACDILRTKDSTQELFYGQGARRQFVEPGSDGLGQGETRQCRVVLS